MPSRTAPGRPAAKASAKVVLPAQSTPSTATRAPEGRSSSTAVRVPYGGLMAAWKKCATCKKVLAGDLFDEGSESCRACVAGPPPKVRAARASAVKTVRPPTPPAERAPLRGVVGSGDLEVRERRAKKAALEQLAEVHAEDYEQLLAAARRAEGLRA